VIRFYFDEHMARPVAEGLQGRGYEVIMAVDVAMQGKDDDTEHLVYAAEHALVIVTFDRPFAGRVMSRTDHAGLICLSEKLRNDIGTIIRLLSQFADRYTLETAQGNVFWLKED
jgi:predicted nuclease of predicted toxin-antitoxin system